MKSKISILVIIFSLFTGVTFSYGQDKIIYPGTYQSNLIDTIWGTPVKDPYRWMENIRSPEVAEWLQEQEKLTNKYTGKTYELEKYLKYYGSVHYKPLIREGNYYFSFAHNQFDNTPELYYQKETDDDPEELFDPNRIDKKSIISIDGIKMSPDNRILALMFSKNGSDWKTIRFLTMKKEKLLDDTINFVKYSDMDWYKDGIFYFRYDVKSTEASFTGTIKHKSLYYHKIGTRQDGDKLVYMNMGNNDATFKFFPNDNFVIMYHDTYHHGKQCKTISYATLNDSIDLRFKDILFTSLDSIDFNVIGKLNDNLLVASNLDTPNGSIYKFNLLEINKMERFIPAYNEQLNFATMMRNKIICAYSNDSASFLVIFDSTGKNLYQSKLPRGHTFGEFSGNLDDSILVFSFHSFFTPEVMYTLNIMNYKTKVLSTTYIHFKYDDIKTKLIYYLSKDGTKIPLYLTYKNGLKLKGQNPVILYGYGGFGIKMVPFFNAANIIFIRNGGILAVPCIRGGGDYPGWHEQGMRLKKQNTFDDFIAAAEYLIKKNYTNPEKLAAMGGSNGGLLVSAVMLQRPDLFKVVVARAGVLDMLRYHLYNIGYHYQEEYGNITDSGDFKNLIHYSPVQNVQKDVSYPATLIVTSDNDDRVDPFNSFKFLASLQTNAPGKNPYILFYEKNAGHTESRDYDIKVNTDAFIYGFIFRYLGIENKINMPEYY